jgi:4-amino-4-deoxy-L-arabinose transferase-like glycosyltransferase
LSTVAVRSADVPRTQDRKDRPDLPRRLRFWRSPEDQPRWARPILLGIAALAALLYAWNIRDSGYALFYSVAVKSMSVSWKAFFYGALDPGATVTIDKLAGSFVPQALSARIFGYHAWSLTLPQVIEGVVAVLTMYRLVRRWFGTVAGLLAASIFALTPVLASMFGHPMEDSLLTMCLVLAADAFGRAVAEARLRSLVLAGVWVGIGFQAKMLQAWMVLPALAITYLLAAPVNWRRRLGHLAAAGAVMLAVSLSWVLLYTVTPPQDRPYIDGSTSNSAFAMVFGYNGLNRFGLHVPGSVNSMIGGGGPGGAGRAPAAGTGVPGGTGGPGGTGQDFAGGPGSPAGGAGAPDAGTRPGGGFGGSGGWTKLLGTNYGTQVGWLYPLALLSLALGLWWHRRPGRRARIAGDDTRPDRTAAFSGFLMWGLWLATFAVIFSRISIPHTAYLASLSPPIVALSAAGIVMFWRTFRDGRAVWALPLAIVAEAAWTLHLTSQFPSFLPWLFPTVAVAGALALGALLAAGASARVRRPALRAGLALGVFTMLVTPGAWAASVLRPGYGGSAFDASAGPSGGVGVGGRVSATAPPDVAGYLGLSGTAPRRPGGGGPGGMAGTDQLDTEQQRIDSYLVAHRGGAKYVAATESWNTAGAYIAATGQPFLPMGGFSGSVPQPTLAAAKDMVARGELRFFLLGGFRGGGLGGRDNAGSTVSAIMSWVRSSCTEVSASEYGGSGTETLYRCT